ncbi:MAG: alanine--tRNA ligase [Chthoniobacterales bacterium]|nr:alanine--tRNA ligase [Chthoniobacterales bacterium]
MTSSQLRNSFLAFFRNKQHTIVPSSSLLPTAPNLLFTNAGMNQFVPLFLGNAPCPFTPPRAADTQKCIRAGGKHNDLEEVGLDTYHHTFFEMLGNWSFGDYFKKEAIEWAWELIVEIWKFPPQRLYATVYKPAEGDPASFDQEAHDLWAALFSKAGLDPTVHIVPGNRKDNFWMMGETGPCGPCSELHVDLTPYGDTRGALVNKGTAECIEIWNLVFIQFNATLEGQFMPLQACHVDTGMGFERLCSIMQNTHGFQEFGNVIISNYETDLFRPLFAELEKKSGLHYRSTLPQPNSEGALIPVTHQEKVDVAFRVIGDHLRTLVFAIADGILPGNTDRHYVLRRILRRAVRYGRTLGFQQPFLYQLVPLLATMMGEAFPELLTQEEQIVKVIHREEESFHKTLEKGLALFEAEAAHQKEISGAVAFRLYDEQGFPLDLTQLLAREQGLSVDLAGFEKLMQEQRERARAAQKKEIITVSSLTTTGPTHFLGFDQQETSASLLETILLQGRTALIFDRSVCYAAMGGQVGDTGLFQVGTASYEIIDTQKQGDIWLHFIKGKTDYLHNSTADANSSVASVLESSSMSLYTPPLCAAAPCSSLPAANSASSLTLPNLHAKGILKLNPSRRSAIARHHTATHLLHWALHKLVGKEVIQKGSFVGPEKLTFDFNSAPLTAAQLEALELLINKEILKNHLVSWQELPYTEIKNRPEIMQFFGDKYGERVRVVQIGGKAGALDGFSMELCGGTHVKQTGEIGLFKIVSEGAVAAGIRRIEAVAGLAAHTTTIEETKLLHSLTTKLRTPAVELEKKIEVTLSKITTLEKELQQLHQSIAAEQATSLLTQQVTLGTIPAILATIAEADGTRLQAIVNVLKEKIKGVILLAGTLNNSVSLMAYVSADFRKVASAGKLIQAIAPLVGGKGGGSPEAARGAGSNVAGVAAALEKGRSLLHESL